MENLSDENKHKHLFEKLDSKNGLERKEARKELVKINDKQVIDALVEMLDHPKHKIRWEAMKTLEEIDDPDLIPVFISKMNEDESDIRWMAAKGLINIGESAVKPLLKLIVSNADSVFVLEGSHHVFNELYKQNKLPENFDIESLLPLLKNTFMSEKIMNTAHELLINLRA